MRLMRFALQQYAAVHSHHHCPNRNILFHSWHHPQLYSTPRPSLFSQRMEKAICLICCERVRLQTDLVLPVTHTCLLSITPPYSPLSSLKANLVAAFEQSLALMTARLQTLSVSSEQKVYQNVNVCYTSCDQWHPWQSVFTLNESPSCRDAVPQ